METPAAATTADQPFTLRTVAASPGRVDAAFVGDLDLANAPLLRDELIRMVDEGLDAMTIDLSGLTFLDSTGIAALVVVRKHALDHGCEFEVHSPPPSVCRVLVACGVDELFGVCGSQDPPEAC